MQAAILRHQRRLNVRGLRMAAEHTALIAVRVGLARKARPAGADHGGGRLKLDAEAGQLGRAGHCMVDSLDLQSTLCLDRVGHLDKGAGHAGHAEAVLHPHALLGFFLHGKAHSLHKDISTHPDRGPLREAAAAVIVGGGMPERRARGAPQPFGPVPAQRDRTLLRNGEQHLKPAALDADVAVTLDHRQGVCGALLPCGGQRSGAALGCQLIARIVRGAAFGGVVPVAHLLHGRLFSAVRIDDAVAAEVVIGRALVKISAVAQHAAAHCIGMPERLIHVVPDETALIFFVPVDQRNVAFHPAERVAHVVHILAEDKRLLGVGVQIFPDGGGAGVHPAFHIADVVKRAAVEHALVMHKAAGIIFPEKRRHRADILAGIALVAAGPDQHRRVVFVALKHAARAIDHAVPPFGQAAGDIPARLHHTQLLPAAVAFKVGFVYHVDAVFIAEVIPPALVGVVAGTHGIDVVALKYGHGSVHIALVNGAALLGIPLMAVDTVEDDAATV